MKKTGIKILLTFLIATILSSCGSKIKSKNDKIYSRHLQEYVPLSVFSTPLERKENVALLLVNGSIATHEKIEETLLDLYKEKKIRPSVIVCIKGDKINAADERSVEKYYSFIAKELLPYVKKKSGIRKFQQISMTGIKENGELAIGFAWENADKIQKAISISSFKDSAENLILKTIGDSRKRPDCKMVFYESNEKNNSDTAYAFRLLSGKKSMANNLEYIRYAGKNNQEAWDKMLPEILIKALNN